MPQEAKPQAQQNQDSNNNQQNKTTLKKLTFEPPLGGLNMHATPIGLSPNFARDLVNFKPPTSRLEVRPGVRLLKLINGSPRGIYSVTTGTRKHYKANWFDKSVTDIGRNDLLVKIQRSDNQTEFLIIPDNYERDPVTVGKFPSSSYSDKVCMFNNTIFFTNGDNKALPYLYNNKQGIKQFHWKMPSGSLFSGSRVSDIDNICVYNQYLYASLKGTLNVVYAKISDVDPSISNNWDGFWSVFRVPASGVFALTNDLQLGGSIIAMFPFGKPNESMIRSCLGILTDKGEFCAYVGTKPNDTNPQNWQLAFHSYLPKPINDRCVVHMEGDVIFATAVGLISLNRVLFGVSNAITESLEWRISGLFKSGEITDNEFRDFIFLAYHKRYRWLIFNVPTQLPIPAFNIVKGTQINLESVVSQELRSAHSADDSMDTDYESLLKTFHETYLMSYQCDYEARIEFDEGEGNIIFETETRYDQDKDYYTTTYSYFFEHAKLEQAIPIVHDFQIGIPGSALTSAEGPAGLSEIITPPEHALERWDVPIEEEVENPANLDIETSQACYATDIVAKVFPTVQRGSPEAVEAVLTVSDIETRADNFYTPGSSKLASASTFYDAIASEATLLPGLVDTTIDQDNLYANQGRRSMFNGCYKVGDGFIRNCVTECKKWFQITESGHTTIYDVPAPSRYIPTEAEPVCFNVVHPTLANDIFIEMFKYSYILDGNKHIVFKNPFSSWHMGQTYTFNSCVRFKETNSAGQTAYIDLNYWLVTNCYADVTNGHRWQIFTYAQIASYITMAAMPLHRWNIGFNATDSHPTLSSTELEHNCAFIGTKMLNTGNLEHLFDEGEFLMNGFVMPALAPAIDPLAGTGGKKIVYDGCRSGWTVKPENLSNLPNSGKFSVEAQRPLFPSELLSTGDGTWQQPVTYDNSGNVVFNSYPEAQNLGFHMPFLGAAIGGSRVGDPSARISLLKSMQDLREIPILNATHVMQPYKSTQYVFDSHYGTWSKYEDINMIDAVEHNDELVMTIPVPSAEVEQKHATIDKLTTKFWLGKFDDSADGDDPVEPEAHETNKRVPIATRFVTGFTDFSIMQRKQLLFVNILASPDTLFVDAAYRATLPNDWLPCRFLHSVDFKDQDPSYLLQWFKNGLVPATYREAALVPARHRTAKQRNIMKGLRMSPLKPIDIAKIKLGVRSPLGNYFSIGFEADVLGLGLGGEVYAIEVYYVQGDITGD
jgi:hypothetical protein